MESESKIDCVICGKRLAPDEIVGSPLGAICKVDADQAGTDGHPYWNWMTDDGFVLDHVEITPGATMEFMVSGKWVMGRVELAWQPERKWYVVLQNDQVIDLTPFSPTRWSKG